VPISETHFEGMIIYACFIFQNALAQLQRNETLAIMADTGARLNILTHMSLGNVQCPPAQYFKDATAEVQKHSTDSSLSIEEATQLLESFETKAKMKICISTSEALTRRLLVFHLGVRMKFQWQGLNIVKQVGSLEYSILFTKQSKMFNMMNFMIEILLNL
jgi:hypothetical protein